MPYVVMLWWHVAMELWRAVLTTCRCEKVVMAVPGSGSRELKSTLHISLPDRLVKLVREVAYRKRCHASHLCRNLIEAGIRKMMKEDQVVVADTVASVDAEALGGGSLKGGRAAGGGLRFPNLFHIK